MQVVGRRDLGRRQPCGHNVETGSQLETQSRGQLHISVHLDRLGDPVVRNELIVGRGETAGIIEGITQADGPWGVGIHIVHVAAGNILSGDRMVIDPFVAVRRRGAAGARTRTSASRFGPVVPAGRSLAAQ